MNELRTLESVNRLNGNKTKNKGKIMKKQHLKAALIASATIAMLMSGCSTKAGTGAAVGGGTGALAGQLIGGNTKSTVIGAGIGAVAGAAIGNSKDKK